MNKLPLVRRQYIDGKYGQIHLRVAEPSTNSDRPGIICLHMSPKSGQSFHQVLPYLSRNQIAVAPDYPGYGESDSPPESPTVTIQDYADSVWKVIDTVVNKPVYLVGYHTGSMVAVEAALQRPNDVLGLVNISAPVFTEEELNELKALFSPIPLDVKGNRFKIMWDRVIEYRGKEMSLTMAAESFAENLRGGEYYEWGHRAAFNYASTYNENLTKLTHPLLVMNVNDDLHEQTLRSDELIKNGKRVEFSDWGHGFLHAYPEQAAKVILEFIHSIESKR
jgi:pimeloyl-ACP methyl ester carboxylesterase